MPKFKEFLRGSAENFAKDALKTIIKGGLDKIERDAWHDFFVKESLARSFYVPYHEYADMWEQALTREDELLATKATMLKGADPRGGFVTRLSTPFDQSAQLQITLTVSGYRDPGDPVQVFIGGAPATEVGTSDTYTADLTAAQPDGNGYPIELR